MRFISSRKDAAASMGRRRADESDAARGDDTAARHDHPLGEHAGAADDPTSSNAAKVRSGSNTIRSERDLVRIGMSLGERRGERPEERVDLLLGCAVVHGEPA